MAFWYETEQYRESMMQYFLSVKVTFSLVVRGTLVSRFVLQVVFAGDNAVGKTSLLVRYTEDAFLTKPKATVTVDHRVRQPVHVQRSLSGSSLHRLSVI